MKYLAKVLHEIENRPGTWRSLKVGVFQKSEDGAESLIGEYVRNYTTLFRTFFPFESNGKEYALYSRDYTATRIMELPSCRDFGGEEPNAIGFCPVDYYVPSYIEREYLDLEDQPHRYRVHDPESEHFLSKTFKWTPLDPKTGQRVEVEKPDVLVGTLKFYPFGFVSGCIWGDDSSYKIQFLDLSRVNEGIIQRQARFGYLELPDALKLKECVDVTDLGYDDSETIWITHKQRFDLNTGKIFEWQF